MHQVQDRRPDLGKAFTDKFRVKIICGLLSSSRVKLTFSRMIRLWTVFRRRDEHDENAVVGSN